MHEKKLIMSRVLDKCPSYFPLEQFLRTFNIMLIILLLPEL